MEDVLNAVNKDTLQDNVPTERTQHSKQSKHILMHSKEKAKEKENHGRRTLTKVTAKDMAKPGQATVTSKKAVEKEKAKV